MQEIKPLDVKRIRLAGKVMVILATLITVGCISLAVVFHSLILYLSNLVDIHYQAGNAPEAGFVLNTFKEVVDSLGGLRNYLSVRFALLITCWTALALIAWRLYWSLQHVTKKYTEMVEIARAAQKEMEE